MGSVPVWGRTGVLQLQRAGERQGERGVRVEEEDLDLPQASDFLSSLEVGLSVVGLFPETVSRVPFLTICSTKGCEPEDWIAGVNLTEPPVTINSRSSVVVFPEVFRKKDVPVTETRPGPEAMAKYESSCRFTRV